MGRAGGGGSRGSRSSGSRSSSRSSGGHRSSSSRSRAGSSSRSSFSSFSSSRRSSSSPRVNVNLGGYGRRSSGVNINIGGSGGYSNSYPTSTYSGSTGSSGAGLFWTIVLIVAIGIIVMGLTMGNAEPTSSYAREKIQGNIAFDSACVTDEIGWFDMPDNAGVRLKNFWVKTGVQPRVLFRAYDSTLTTDDMKQEWAEQYYENNIEDENTFLFVYFAEKDTDNDVGYMSYVNGYSVNGMMDAEAIDIFWNYIDKYWYTDMSTDDVIVKAFNETADRITTKSTTTMDLMFALIIGGAVLIVLVLILAIIIRKQRAQAEKDAATERILKADIGDLAKSSTEESLVNKYTNKE